MSKSRRKSPWNCLYETLLVKSKKRHPSLVFLLGCIMTAILVGGMFVVYHQWATTIALTTAGRMERSEASIYPVVLRNNDMGHTLNLNLNLDCTLSLAQRQQLQHTPQQPLPPQPQKQQQPRFLLVLGLEGTGHHLVQKIVTHSPMYQWLESSDIHPKHTRPLGQALFRSSTLKNRGLLSATCQTDPMGSIRKPNITRLFNDVVERLSELQNEVITTQQQQRQQQHQKSVQSSSLLTSSSPSSIVIPVNAMLLDPEVGQLSYPNFAGPCRRLDSPNLDVWYEACRHAKVSCQHVYLYRDPYAVVRSTLRRQFEQHAIEAIHLYTTHLQLLYAQLSTSPPGTTIGCWNLLEPKDQQASSDPSSSSSSSSSSHAINSSNNDWKETMGPLLGWTNQSDLFRVFDSVYREPPNNRQSVEKFSKEVAPLQAYMDSMVRVHERVIQLCQAQVSWYQQRRQKQQ